MTDDQLRQVQQNKRTALGLSANEPRPSAAQQTVSVPCPICGEPVFVSPFLTYLPRKIAHTACLAVYEQRREAEQREADCRARQAALDAVRVDLPGTLVRCGAPEHWRGASFDSCPDMPSALVDTARQWANDPDGVLYLYGQPGAGKTYLAVASLRAVLDSGLLPPSACRFISERAFLDDLKASFTPDAPPINPRLLPVNHPRRVGLLVLDDLAASRLTDWGKGEIAGLLEARHAADLPTIVTSNVSPGALGQAVDGRVASRIAESRMLLEFPARDLRICGTTRTGDRNEFNEIAQNHVVIGSTAI